MYLDFKVTSWERLYIPEELSRQVEEKLKSGEIQTANDAIELFEDRGVYYEGHIAEVEEQMTVEENGGSSTIELIGSNGGDPIFKNGI